MKLLKALFGRPREGSPLEIDHDSLEEAITPLLVTLLGVIVLFSLF